jgi:hypothetical protein
MSDPTEESRRALQARTNREATERASLEEKHGEVLDTGQLREGFQVHSFLAPFIIVTRLSSGERGTLMFQHNPRLYFSWQSDGGA